MSNTAEPKSAFDRARAFLEIAADFSLGDLPTEKPNPKTSNLSELAKNDLPEAYSILKGIDVEMMDVVLDKYDEIDAMADAMKQTRENGGRVFFYGCGATGRLSVSIGYLWREQHIKAADKKAQVVDFMSGGDVALVHSIENFEDHPEWGAQQLRDNGFGENDLLIAITEGGETPSVIGAVNEAAKISNRKPFFLYCNPDDTLRPIERSRAVLDNEGIIKLPLITGPQALSGSTRMQASTVQMLAAGAALLDVSVEDIRAFKNFLDRTDLSFLAAFTELEAQMYEEGHKTLYETSYYGPTIITDTTERAPTFSLKGFENQHDDVAPEEASLTYFRSLGSRSVEEALRKILLRDPVAIEWPEIQAKAGHERLLGFDFSHAALNNRERLLGYDKMHTFRIERKGDHMRFSFGDLRHEIDVSTLPPLLEHLFLKVALNAHSTLVMGRIGRYENNIMTYVKPSNNKLIDRAIRYVTHLLEQKGIEGVTYEQICHRLYENTENMKPDDPIVMLTYNSLIADYTPR